MRDTVVGFAGMTHLGLNSAVASAERGFTVICYDPAPQRIEALRRGELPVVEPDLPELRRKNADRLIFTGEAADLARCDLLYVAPDVPTNNLGESDLDPLRSLIAEVNDHLRPDAIMVVLSQVPPGFTRGLKRHEGTRYYQVETLVFGRAMERALHPERFIVGCADPEQPLPPAMAEYLVSFGCPILPMRYESAELCKISINMFLVAAVSTANSIAELCENIGADWSEIVPALRLDKRIGQHAYIAAGLGIAGGNLERDLATFVRMGSATGTDVGVTKSWQTNSLHRRYWALHRLHSAIFNRIADPVVAILGLAYKENTASVKNSPAVALVKALRPFRLRTYDPSVTAAPDWHPRLVQMTDALSACEGADAVVLMTPWREFRTIAPHELARVLIGRDVIDPFGLLDAKECRAAGLAHHRLGTPATTS